MGYFSQLHAEEAQFVEWISMPDKHWLISFSVFFMDCVQKGTKAEFTDEQSTRIAKKLADIAASMETVKPILRDAIEVT